MSFGTANERWSGLGPYYAMFPVKFAYEVITKYSEPGDWVLDPFAGRGSSIFAACTSDRYGSGTEINPVGWLYSNAKLNPASLERVIARLKALGRNCLANDYAEVDGLPDFFSYCFSKNVNRFLLECRRNLNWRHSSVDATLAAIILVYLHGKQGSALSNQMRQSKSMSPQYSVAWWQERELYPPELDPVDFLEQRIIWRYAKGRPATNKGQVLLGDATAKLHYMARYTKEVEGFSLLFTSPPYCGVTNYYYDQWLRLWFLGDTSRPTYGRTASQGKFESQVSYYNLLRNVFTRAKLMLKPNAAVYVRTDMRAFTLKATIDVLREVFPCKDMYQIGRPISKPSQTALFGDGSKKPGEVDLILQ